MSIRAVWIVRLSQSNSKIPKCLSFRKFPTVEKKTKDIEGDAYIPIPTCAQFLPHLLVEVGLAETENEFVSSRDRCSKKIEKPVFEVGPPSGKLWPIVIIEQQGLLFCCLVHVAQGAHTHPNIVEIPGVSLAFSLLCGISEFFKSTSNQDLVSRMPEFYNYLNEATPFGIPRDTCYDSITAKLLGRAVSLPKSQKQPAWKPLLYKGKGVIYITVTECIKASQCEQGESQDTWDVYGSISCRADLEGTVSDITLNVSHQIDRDAVPMDHLIIHPCVQSADAGLQDTGFTGRNPPPRRMRFVPPTEQFTLCQYSASALQELPIFGVYKMKCDSKTASLSVQLKLSDQVRNNFEYCELQIAFFNRGVVSLQDTSSSQGNVSLSPDKTILVWNVGPKFPSKTLEVSMSVHVLFSGPAIMPSTAEELFCTGLNSYAQLYFKIPDFTHTGCYIDPRSIQVSPSSKFKLNAVREYMSTDYKIWNSHGSVLSTKD